MKPLLRVLVAFAALHSAAPLVLAQAQPPAHESLRLWVDQVDTLAPRTAGDYEKIDTAAMAKAAEAVDAWTHRVFFYGGATTPEAGLAMARHLLVTKKRIDEILDRTLDVRGQFAALPEGDTRRATICNYLRTCAQLIDLSGRIRFQQDDAFNYVLGTFIKDAASLEAFLDLLIEYRSTVGANVLAGPVLAHVPGTPPEEAFALPFPVTATARSKLLRLIAVSGQNYRLVNVAEFLKRPEATASLTIQAAQTIREVGLPQDVRPGTPSDLPLPAITAATLYERLSRLSNSRMSAEDSQRRTELLAWLNVRRQKGIVESGYRLGSFDVQPGDWLLMRNPSPYNLFTDLSPGLFTHVGVVTVEQSADGIRRMVLVDLQERGSRIPATNVETFVQRSLNYSFLRHPDPAVAKAIADAARSVIGNESEFDLNFRTTRVTELKGQKLTGRKIQTYCAGLLLLCALQSQSPREEFFPMAEGAAGGYTRENLTRLGMSIGEDFISPTGALFSPKMLHVGRREPMYDPKREVEEAIFDHFAKEMVAKQLSPAPDLFNDLRLKLAQASRQNPLLAQALARAAGVNSQMDLVAAAKAAAVVETLDAVAFNASAQFLEARSAILSPPPEQLLQEAADPRDVQAISALRRKHPDLVKAMQEGKLSPRALRVGLVKFYIDAGKTEIDRRFFGAKPTPAVGAQGPTKG